MKNLLVISKKVALADTPLLVFPTTNLGTGGAVTQCLSF